MLGDCDLQPDNWKTENPHECQILCQDLKECTEFTWIAPGHEGKWKKGRNRCCLKTNKNKNPIAAKGRISGPKFFVCINPYISKDLCKFATVSL